MGRGSELGSYVPYGWTAANVHRLGGGYLLARDEESGVVELVEREFFIDNLLVQIHSVIEMILLDRPCAMGV